MDHGERISRRTLGLAAALSAARLALPMPALAQAAARRGGTAVLGMTEPTNVNPDLSTSYSNQLVGCMIYEGLVQVARDSSIEPLLATSWEISPDRKTYTFKLADAKWHDGRDFTAADVKYTIENVSSKFAPVFASAAATIESIETPDAKTVIFHLKTSFGPFLMSLAAPQGGAILPKHLFEGTDPLQNPASSTAPVGTGPFKLVEWSRGAYLKLVANDRYWQPERPYLKELIVRLIPQSTSRLQALRAGEIDYIPGYFVAASDHSVIKATDGLKLENSGFAPGTKMMFMNFASAPLGEKAVRHALMMATDREFLFRNVWFGTGGIGVMPFTSRMQWAADPSIDYRQMYPFDVDKANAALDAAGHRRGSNGSRFTLRYIYAPESADSAQAGLALKSMWQKIGVDVRLIAVEGAAYADRVYTRKDFDVTIVGYTSYGDPAIGIARVFVSSAIGRPYGNASQYSNPEVDELFVRGAAATDLAERAVFYKEAQRILADELPVLTLQEYQHEDAARTALRDVWGGQGYGRWGNAWLAE